MDGGADRYRGSGVIRRAIHGFVTFLNRPFYFHTGQRKRPEGGVGEGRMGRSDLGEDQVDIMVRYSKSKSGL